MTEAFENELVMLRDFYESWVAYHTIRPDNKEGQKQMADYMIHVHTCIQQELAPKELNG